MTDKDTSNDLNEVLKNYRFIGITDLSEEDMAKIQRSFYVQKYIWDAADGLPISRPEIITQALLNAITAYKSEAAQLRYDITNIDKQIETLLAQRTAKVNTLIEIEKAESEKAKNDALSRIAIEQAVVETMNLVDMFRKKMTPSHFKRLETISGIPAAEIKTFLEENDYSPETDKLRMFYQR
jgi:hypothetical protein